MVEVGAHSIRRFLDASELGERLPFQVCGIAGRDAGMDRALEVAVEVLVGIELGRVGRQEEELDERRIALDPCGHLPSLVDLEIVEDQEDAPLPPSRQTPQEAQQHLGAQRTFVDHESNRALVGDGRDDGQARAADRDPKNGRLAARGIAPMARLVAAKAGLVAPADFGPLCLGVPRDPRILHAQPPLDRRVVPLVGPPRRPLRRHPPTLEIQPDRADRHGNAETGAEQLLNRTARPERKRKPKLVRASAADPTKRPLLLLRRQMTPGPLRPTATLYHVGELGPLLQRSCQRHAVRSCVARDRTDFLERLPLAAQRQNLPTQLGPRLRTGTPPIVFPHASRIA